MNKTFATIHKVLTAFIGLGVFVQMFLAGVWHAGVVQTPGAHVFFGLALLLASLLALIAAAVGKLPRAIIGRTALVFVLILLQPILIETRRQGLPIISAFHTLNAAFIGMFSGSLAAMNAGSQAETSEAGSMTVVAGD